jgi:glucokinase
LEQLSLLAKKNNKKAIQVWEYVGNKLGVAFVALANTLNLDAIVVGGGVSAAGSVLLNAIKKTIKDRAMSVQAKRVKIFTAALGNDAGLIGAAILVKEGLSA